jgi:hypothetical protein
MSGEVKQHTHNDGSEVADFTWGSKSSMLWLADDLMRHTFEH